jgi:hypothetical protein
MGALCLCVTSCRVILGWFSWPIYGVTANRCVCVWGGGGRRGGGGGGGGGGPPGGGGASRVTQYDHQNRWFIVEIETREVMVA